MAALILLASGNQWATFRAFVVIHSLPKFSGFSGKIETLAHFTIELRFFKPGTIGNRWMAVSVVRQAPIQHCI